jgi:hypothetical protein
MFGDPVFMDNSYGRRYSHEKEMLQLQLGGQRDQQQGQNDFTSRENELNRLFGGQQAEFGRGEAALDRDAAWRSLLQTQGFQGDQAHANRVFQNEQAGLDRSFTGGENERNRMFQGSQAGLDRDAAWRSLLEQNRFVGGQNDANRAFQGGQNEADRGLQLRMFEGGDATARRGQDLSLQAAQLPWNYRRETRDAILPQIQGLLGGAGGAGGMNPQSFQAALAMLGGGGAGTPPPALPSSQVLSDAQVGQQVNAAQAANQSAAVSQRQAAASDLAARGFGSRSPLAAALNAQIGTSTNMANADAARETQLEAARQNAEQGVRVGQLATTQWATGNQMDLERRRAAGNLMLGNQQNATSLIAALAGMIG